MKRIALSIALLAMVLGAAQADVISLNDDWRLQSSAKISGTGSAIAATGFNVAGWYPTPVPRTVLAALVDNKVYPDPYYGLNLKSIPGYQDRLWLRMREDSPFAVSWWYRKEFDAPADLAGKQVGLHLDGINYQANVWLNGKLIASSDDVKGMFRRFEFDVADNVLPGKKNCLAVEIIPPGLVPDKNYRTKQIQATTGWDDHNPQPPDLNMGIWEDVYLSVTGPVRIANPYVHADLETPSLDMAHLTVWAHLKGRIEELYKERNKLDIVLHGRIGSIEFSKPIPVDEDIVEGDFLTAVCSPLEFEQLNIAKPRVWWPNPLGPQDMYELELSVTVNGEPSDSIRLPFAIRKTESYIDENGWRGFRINGRNILIRGGAWMTSDMLLRFDNRRYDALVRYAKEANLNMLRLEGFSIRETNEFYATCDKYGVMVTQQLFGRSIPDEALAIDCIRDTVLRIRNHPSLVHFLGHDETLPRYPLDEAYRGIIAKYAPDRSYQPHSGAFDIEGRYLTGGTRTGTRELWTYAGPRKYYDGHEDGAWGFAQSGGIGGIIAPYESVRRFIPQDQQWPLWTDAMSFHTVTQGGHFFDAAIEAMNKRYGEPASIEDFCRTGQVMNYECARAMFEAYGRNKYDAKGITTWKYDAAWPAVMTWHYVDWNLIASGAYYGAKKACAPLHVQYSYDDHSVYVVNTLSKARDGLHVVAKVYSDDMRVVQEQSANVSIESDGKTRAFVMEWPRNLTSIFFLSLELSDSSSKRIDENIYWLSSTPDSVATNNDQWVGFKVEQETWANLKGLRSLKPAAVNVKSSTRTDGSDSCIDVTLTNDSNAIAFGLRLAILKGSGGDEVAPCYWSDNIVSLLPGTTRTLRAQFAQTELDGAPAVVRVEGWNVQSVSHETK
ncbi:MAG: hypothetical protein K1Y02_10035 [Candidatus Hydrogenedentes bacterium]|nr:hypothetical protein [Candidatus Hydrogenedentota bacterium]